MKHKSLQLLLLLPIALFLHLSCADTDGANLIFKSGFDGVNISPPTTTTPSCSQTLSGGGFPLTINGEEAHFQHIIGADIPADYDRNQDFQVRIEEATGPHGNKTQVLYHMFKNPQLGGPPWPSSNLALYSAAGSGDIKKLYFSYWMKISPDYLAMADTGWKTLFAWKTGCVCERMEAYINGKPSKGETLYWHVHQNVNANGKLHHYLYRRDNKTVPVPIGQWFFVEAYWNHSEGADGRLWWYVNGEQIVDYKGITSETGIDIGRLYFFAHYGGSKYGAQKQWFDDFEIWDDFPCGEGKSRYNAVRGPNVRPAVHQGNVQNK